MGQVLGPLIMLSPVALSVTILWMFLSQRSGGGGRRWPTSVWVVVVALAVPVCLLLLLTGVFVSTMR